LENKKTLKNVKKRDQNKKRKNVLYIYGPHYYVQINVVIAVVAN